jgi:outer membrane lipoprotein carrier protein
MKLKLLIWPLLFSLMLVAQHDPVARHILDGVSKKYSELASFKAHYTAVSENQAANTKSTTSGEIIVKGNKYHIKMSSQEIYNNGTTVWTHIKENNDVNITNNDPGDDVFNPAKIFHLYKHGYKYRHVEDKMVNGVNYEVIELNPDDVHSRYFKIRIEVSRKDYIVRFWQVFEKNGNKHSWTVDEFVPNFAVEDSHFNFDRSKCPGCNFIDLR